MRTTVKVKYDGNSRWATVTVGIDNVEATECEPVRLQSGQNANDKVAISAATVVAVAVATARAEAIAKALAL